MFKYKMFKEAMQSIEEDTNQIWNIKGEFIKGYHKKSMESRGENVEGEKNI